VKISIALKMLVAVSRYTQVKNKIPGKTKNNMMKLMLTLLLFFYSANAFSQSPAAILYKDTVNKFSIKIPAGWRYGVNKNYPELKLLANRSATDTSDKPHENFNLNILEKKNSSLEIQYEKLISALLSTNDFNLVKADNININGQPYKWFIENHKNNINAAGMINYVFMTYKNDKTYILAFVSLEKDFDKYEKLFTETANTFIL
jgi:hypothetical protein